MFDFLNIILIEFNAFLFKPTVGTQLVLIVHFNWPLCFVSICDGVDTKTKHKTYAKS